MGKNSRGRNFFPGYLTGLFLFTTEMESLRLRITAFKWLKDGGCLFLNVYARVITLTGKLKATTRFSEIITQGIEKLEIKYFKKMRDIFVFLFRIPTDVHKSGSFDS